MEEKRQQGKTIEKLPHPRLSLNPMGVMQNEGVIMDAKNGREKSDSLYTFGARPCLILVVVEEENGRTERIGLAHISPTTSEESIRQFIAHFNYNGNVKISIISGKEETTLRTFKVIKEMGLVSKIDYFDVDFDGSRSDAVCVDREGTIYYGNVPSWNRKANEQQLELYARSIPLRPASMWNLEITEV